MRFLLLLIVAVALSVMGTLARGRERRAGAHQGRSPCRRTPVGVKAPRALRQQLFQHPRDPAVPRRTVVLPIHVEFREELSDVHARAIRAICRLGITLRICRTEVPANEVAEHFQRSLSALHDALPRAAPPATACGPLCPVTAEPPACTTKSGFVTGAATTMGTTTHIHPPGSPRGRVASRIPVLPAAIANLASPSALQEHGLLKERSMSCAQAQSRSRRAPPECSGGASSRGSGQRPCQHAPRRASPSHWAVTGAVTPLSPTTPTPSDRDALTCTYASTLD